MKRFVFLLGMFLVLTFAVSAKETVKVGVILPLTGNNQQLGAPVRELIEYKFAHMPDSDHFDYEVVFEDDQLTPRLSLLAAKRLVEVEHVDVLVSFFGLSAEVLCNYATQKEVLHINWAFKEVCDGIYNFDRVTRISEIGELWTKTAHEKGYKRLGLLIVRNTGGELMIKNLVPHRDDKKMEWVINERFVPGQRDFRMTLQKIRAQKPDLFFLFAIEPELQIIMRQMDEMGWNIPLSAIQTPDISPNLPGFEGVWYLSADSPLPEYAAWYKSTFGKFPPYGVSAYDDIVGMLHEGFESLGVQLQRKPTSLEMSAYLNSVEAYQGACGPISCDENGILKSPPYVLIMRNGEPVREEAEK